MRFKYNIEKKAIDNSDCASSSQTQLFHVIVSAFFDRFFFFPTNSSQNWAAGCICLSMLLEKGCFGIAGLEAVVGEATAVTWLKPIWGGRRGHGTWGKMFRVSRQEEGRRER